MKKTYQTDELVAAIPLPASVSVAMDDIAETMREGCWPWLSAPGWG